MKKQTLFLIGMAAAVVTLTGCSSNEGSEQVTRKSRTLTITQSAVQQKSILVDQGENGLNATWEMGDQMTVYNQSYPAAGYATVKASASTKNANFVGKADCQAGVVLRLFYPKVSESGSVTDATNNGTLTLDISNQKGTLEDIQQHFDFNYGQATVTAVDEETATANAGTTENLMAICKFTFKSEGSYLKKISSVKISGVPTTATFTLSARNTPALTPATTASTINISADGMDNAVYVALFPGETTPTFTLTAGENTYEGTLPASTLKAGKFYNSVVVEITKTGDAPVADYVEVCGTKWAKGNLWYDPVNGGDEGFLENWRIAPNQWEWIGYDQDVSTINYNNLQIKDNFTWATTSTEPYNTSSSGRLFPATNLGYLYDEYRNTQIPDEYDVALNATNNKWRMPKYTELEQLANDASYQYGYYELSNNTKVYGVLFTNPNGERKTDLSSKKLSEEEISTGLFLPAGGFIRYGKNRGFSSSNPTNREGVYPSSFCSYIYNTGNTVFANMLFFSNTVLEDASSFKDEYYRSVNEETVQFKIRPVLNE